METPPRKKYTLDGQGPAQPRRKYTDEEKKQLLANLDLEVRDRIRQFEAYLAHSLEAFKLRHENEVTRIPRAIRTLTVAEFADKYDGDVNKALQAITKARMEASGEPAGIDGSTRKRKWQPCADESQEAGSSRAAKSARVASPEKKDVAGARPRLVKTPGARLRRPPPSPASSTFVKASPFKSIPNPSPGKHRMPSTILFNPALPKTPAYPRRPRANESLLSANGSPLTSQVPALEVALSIKVLTKDGSTLEFDPLVTSAGDLELLDGVSDDAKRRAKEELQELSGLMARLGKWRI